MALTAKFISDFTSFYTAVEKAQAKLADFDTDAQAVTASLDKMVESLSGRALIQNATLMARAVEEVGGVSALTEQELGKVSAQAAEAVEKMKALGIEVPPELQKLADAEKDVANETEGMTLSFGKLFASYFTAEAAWDLLKAGFSMTIGFMKDSIAAAAEAEASTARMISALRAQGTAMPDVIDAYRRYIDELKNTTTFSGSALESSIALLAQIGNVGPESMQKALLATANLAARTGDLDGASMAVAKAHEGQLGALRRLIPGLDETTAKGMSFDQVLDLINTKFKGAAVDAANTYEGRLKQLGNTWGDVQESIGKAVTQNQTVVTAVELVTKAMQDQNKDFAANKQVMNLVSDAVIILIRGFSLFLTVVSKTGQVMAGTISELAFFADGIEGILDLMTRFVRVVAYLGDVTAKQMLPVLEGMHKKTVAFRDGLQDAGRRTAEFSQFTASLSDKVDDLADGLAATRGQTVQFTESQNDAGTATGGVIRKTQEQIEAEREAEEQRRRLAKLNKDLALSLVPLTAAQEASIRSLEAMGRTTGEIALKLGVSETVVKRYIETTIKWEQSVRSFGAAALTVIPRLTTYQDVIDGVYQNNRDLTYQLTAAQIKTDAFGNVLTANVIPALKGVGPELVAATDATKTFGETITDYFQKDFGRIIVQGIAGGGHAAKAALTGLGNALFAKDGAFGSALTKGVSGLFGDKGVMGTISKSLAGMVPMIGSFIGPAVEGVTKLFGKLFGKSEESAKVSPLRDEFFKLQGGLETLNPRVQQLAGNLSLVQAVFDAKTVEQYNAAITNLNALFQQEQDAIAAVTEAAQRYGITLEELGPALQKQQLDKQAQQLYKDFQLLTAAGVDSVAVTKRMSEAVNKYVQQAMAMGAEVPIAMRPMLEKMIEMGTLTDASGRKVEKLEDSGISFAMTMSEGFNALIKEVQKLTDLIGRSLGTAIENTARDLNKIPKTVPVTIVYKEKNKPSESGSEVPGYQEGTKGKFVDFGPGTLVMLHGKEAVVPEGQPLMAAGSLAPGGNAAPVTIVINAQGAFFDTPASLQRLADKVNEALTQKYGITNRLKAA